MIVASKIRLNKQEFEKIKCKYEVEPSNKNKNKENWEDNIE